MAKDIPLNGQDDRGDTKFEKAQDTGSQINVYVGEKDNGSKHCHMFKEHDSGKSGVVHRGGCHVCDDVKKASSNQSSSSSDSNPSSGSSSGGK